MKDYRPDGCKMYVAIKDLEFPSFELFGPELHISKGEVWMLKQINFGDRIWLNKRYEEERFLQIPQEQLASDFVEVNLNEVNMNTVYEFNGDECTKTVMLNGYEIGSETYSCSFDDFCEKKGYPLEDWIR